MEKIHSSMDRLAASKAVTMESVKAVVGRTWFSLEQEGDNFLFETRDNGDVGEERAGRLDIVEGKRIAVALRSAFKDSDVEFDICDEWVTVDVRF